MVFRTAKPPECLEYGTDFGEEGVDLGLDRFMIAVCKLRARAFGQLRELRTASGVEMLAYVSEFQDVFEQVENLDSALSDWCASLPQEWLYSTHLASKMLAEFPPTTENPYYPKTTHIYNSINHAIQWNRYRCFRLITNGLVFKAVAWQRDITGTDPVGGGVLEGSGCAQFSGFD